MNTLIALLRAAKNAGKPYERDVAMHALLLMGNGWDPALALAESQRTLDDAEEDYGRD